jgi:hypothetical protein
MIGDTTKAMRSTLESKLDGATSDAHIDTQTARERKREREPLDDELWTLAVTQALVSELPRVSPAPESPEGAPPGAALDSAPDSLPSPARAGWEAAVARGAAEYGAAEGAASSSDAAADGLPAELCTEVSDERFGKLRLVVARGARGLDIVINVADSHVKALIEAEQSILMKTLKDAGLAVASVQIGSAQRPGTLLAQDRGGSGKARESASLHQPVARWRTYPGSAEEDAESDGVDLTA